MTESISNIPNVETSKKENYTGPIYMKDRRIAVGSNVPGKELPLEKLLHGDTLHMKYGDEKIPVSRVFLKTETGNIYGIRYSKENGGEIINAKNDITTPFENYNIRNGEQLKIKIGEPFHYQAKSDDAVPQYYDYHSSKVVEILTISDEKKSDTIISNMSQGYESSIPTDFKRLREEHKNS
jgi:hypothetical protein